MAKSKNHTNHKQNRKAHRNSIERPTRFHHKSALGMDQKFLMDQTFCRKSNLSAAESKKCFEERNAADAGKPKPVKL